MAEDDDDDTFGDFSFAPNPPAAAAANDDDDWGDFLQSPEQSKSSDSFASTPPPQWVKPRGALPLSIFGDLEEEEGGIGIDAAVVVSSNGATDSKSSSNWKSESSIVLDPNLDSDSVSEFNGFYPKLDTLSSSNKKNDSSVVLDRGVDSASVAGASEFSGFYPKLDTLSSSNKRSDSSVVDRGVDSGSVRSVGGVASEFSGFYPSLDALSSLSFDVNGKKEESNGGVANVIDDGDDDDGGWEFKDAFSEARTGWNVDNEVKKDYNFDSSSNKKGGNSVVLDRRSDLDSLSSLAFDRNGTKGESSVGVDNAVDDDGWEFKDAFSESRTSWNLDNEVDITAQQVSERSAYSPGEYSGSNQLQDLFGTSNGSVDLFSTSSEPASFFAISNGTPQGSVDLFLTSNEPASFFATSNGTSSSFHEVGFPDIIPTATTLNDSMSDTNIKVGKNIDNGIVDTGPDAGSSENDEDFGEFTAAFAETLSKPGVEKGTELYHSGSALPLSIFGIDSIEEPKLDVSSDIQDPFVHPSTSDARNGPAPTPVISLDDLISSLYSNNEQPSPIITVHTPTEIELNHSNEVSSSNLVIDDDYFDDNSWDFKDASSQTGIYNEESLYGIGDSHRSFSPKLKLNDHLDFYSKLKEELVLVTKGHVESLKQSRSNIGLDGEDTNIEAIDRELQFFHKELEQINSHSEEQDSQNQSVKDHHLNSFVELLMEPQFQILQSEYQLSQKLLLAEKDLRPAIELLRHTNTMLKILNVGTSEERSVYISVWSDMIAVCAQELKHGVLLWNQAVEKKVQTHLLSEPQGRKFVLALGEIYRVVAILGASAKVFKPWTFSVDSSGLYILIQECHTLWSTSGLEEALSNVSAPIDLDAASLLNSIKYISGLDALALQNYIDTEKESRCWLSVLTSSVAPGLKMIMWGNKQCFVTIANLWVNLISCNPPILPQLEIV